ncbi:glycosyltransferase [Aquimarina pacifica]|uniref:glycosyltransferase n=1 Tax=Aquimarina pacifica TaxID=1296415 RepID=UPI0004713BB1|nr:glycosyltransferase [Aquimarina pacifica]
MKSNRIKVAHVLQSVGGVDVYLRLVTENIDAANVENIIIHQKGESKKKYLNSYGEEIKQFFIPIQREISLFKDIMAVYKTIKILKNEKPDVLHAHSAKGGIIARAASIFFRINVLHTPHAYSYLSAKSPLKRKLFLFLERVFRKFNSILLATSESERIRGVKEVGYSNKRALKFNNSIIPLDAFGNSPHLDLPNKYICTVGRPSYQKNIEMMINVIKKVKDQIPDVYLVIMGVGQYSPNRDNIVELIKELNLDNNVILINWIEREKILAIIKNSLFYISTSRYEGLPYSIIESLALSKACVVTECDGNRDLVKDNYNGYIVENSNHLLMAKKIIELYKNDKLRKKFEENSSELFKNNYNLNFNIRYLEDIYKEYSK